MIHVIRNIIHMLLGSSCKYPGQDYSVIYHNGAFIVEGSGTLIGNIGKLQRIK